MKALNKQTRRTLLHNSLFGDNFTNHSMSGNFHNCVMIQDNNGLAKDSLFILRNVTIW